MNITGDPVNYSAASTQDSVTQNTAAVVSTSQATPLFSFLSPDSPASFCGDAKLLTFSKRVDDLMVQPLEGGEPTIKLYHGTSMNSASNILSAGFARSSKQNGGYVEQLSPGSRALYEDDSRRHHFFTTDKGAALEIGNAVAGASGSINMKVTLTKPQMEALGFQEDPNMLTTPDCLHVRTESDIPPHLGVTSIASP